MKKKDLVKPAGSDAGETKACTPPYHADTAVDVQLQPELQCWQNVMLDREDPIIELKREVNEMLNRAAQPQRYPSAVEKR